MALLRHLLCRRTASSLLALCVSGLAHDLRMGYARHFRALSFAEAEALNAGEQQSALHMVCLDELHGRNAVSEAIWL